LRSSTFLFFNSSRCEWHLKRLRCSNVGPEKQAEWTVGRSKKKQETTRLTIKLDKKEKSAYGNILPTYGRLNAR